MNLIFVQIVLDPLVLALMLVARRCKLIDFTIYEPEDL